MQVSELFKQSNTILLDGGMGTMLHHTATFLKKKFYHLFLCIAVRQK